MQIESILFENPILLALILFPVVVGFFMQVNSSHLFFSVMAGELLGRYFGHDLEAITHSPYSEAALITAPLFLTAIFLSRSIKKRFLILHLVPFTITGVIYAIFVVPTLPDHIIELIQRSYIGNMFLHMGDLIIGTVIVVQLLALWYFHRSEKPAEKE